METKSKTTKTWSAWTKKLDVAVPYTYTWRVYPLTPEGEAEFIAAKQEMTLKEQMKARNAAASNAARNKAQGDALEAAGYPKPTMKTSELLQLKGIYNSLMASGKHTEASARALAAQTLGTDWPDSDDDDDE